MAFSVRQQWICVTVVNTAIIILACLNTSVEGVCYMNNMSYANNSVWDLSSSCQVCRCQEHVPVCEKTICLDPQCDSTKGKVLALSTGQCCPVCAISYKPCTYQGHQIPRSTHDVGSLIPHNAEWSTEPCETCHCTNGSVECAKTHCAAVHCGTGELSQRLPDDCCPKCMASGRMCHHFGDSHADGTEWSPVACSKCVCRNGQTICFVHQCPPILCQQGDTLKLSNGDCCPKCVAPVCLHKTATYQDGASWKVDRCSHCTCVRGEVQCGRQRCRSAHIKCQPHEQLTWRRNRCCPECVPKGASCEESDVVHYQGEIWNTSICDYCACHDGRELCSSVHCGGIRCAQDEELVMMPNECCRRCLAHKGCVMSGRTYKHGASWQRSACDYCSCEDGEAVCYTMPCSVCPPGSVRARMAGECCGQCKPVQCDAQCATCSARNAMTCESCSDLKLLLQEGRCLARCSDGFFLNTRNVCQRCHRSCATCREETAFHCITCPAGFVWSDGECLSLCPSNNYEEEASCSPCHRSCGSCFGPRQSQCESCRLPWKLLQDNRCVDFCSEEKIGNNGICIECGRGCAACQSSEGEHCNRCPDGMVLQHKRCVTNCDQRYFLQGNICKRCSSRCLMCQDFSRCIQCNSRSFLVNDTCSFKCPPGFSPNTDRRTCEEILAAPRLLSNNSIRAVSSRFCVVTPAMLRVAGAAPTGLRYHVIRPPTNGRLTRTRAGSDQPLGASAVFSHDELSSGKIRFLHDRQMSLSEGNMELWVSDGSRGGPRQEISISVTSAQPPQLAKNILLVVDKGGSGEISTDKNLAISDDDSWASLLVTVLKDPLYGSVVERGSESVSIRAFSLDVLKSGRLMYKHDGSNEQHDHLLLQASDGYNILNILFNIEIRRKGSKEPQMVHNNEVYVEPGQMVQIIREDLEAETLGGRPSSDLIYTLTPPTNNPQQGDIVMVVPMPEGGATEGWTDIGGGQMAAKMFRFLQRDINEGRIWYQHNGGTTNSDFFRFEVSDRASPGDALADQETYIVVLQPLLGERFVPGQYAQEALEGGSVPYLDRTATLSLMVLENQIATISSADLAFSDEDTPVSDIIYHITRPLAAEDGTVEHVDRPFVPAVEFTQEDLDEGNIIYRPPTGELGQFTRTCNFYFTVEDGQDGHHLPEQKFSLLLTPVNDSPPELARPDPLVMTSQGGTVLIGPAVIAIHDADTRLEDLIFSLDEEPLSGDFLKKSDTYEVVLRKGDQFTMSEVEANEFYYLHDASREFTDVIRLSVSDGAHTVPINVKVKVIRTDRSSPLQHPDATMMMTIEEDSTRVVDRSQLAFIDVKTSETSLQIILASTPQFGHLVFRDGQALGIGSRFTQEDIDRENIRYSSKREIGMTSVSEPIYFNVSDDNGNTLPMQLFSVTITPANNQPPSVSLDGGIQLEEGQEKLLSVQHFMATDPDTPLDQLTVFMETPPSFGLILNTRRASSEPLTSFPLQELLAGHIVYRQTDHEGKEPTADGFLFYVTDGVNQSPTYKFNISIDLVNDERPVLVSEQVLCQEKSGVLITNASVFVTDLDTPPDRLIFSLTTPPAHGHIRVKQFATDTAFAATLLTSGDKFSYQDILRGLIVYTHDGQTVVDTDGFSVTLSDGRFNVTSHIEVIIGLVNDETPRMAVNRGLRVKSGSVTQITSSELQATDVDSDDDLLTFTVMTALSIGAILKDNEDIRIGKRVFTQLDINQGRMAFSHMFGEETGICLMKFDVADQHGNRLIDQTFLITILEDRTPPEINVNNELRVVEGMSAKITTAYLSATDTDTESSVLRFTLKQTPVLGHLAFADDTSSAIVTFTQADLAASAIEYVHTSDEELYLDTFIFTVSDSKNEATQKFYVTILPVDDSLPLLINNGLNVQEGVRKLITEFELKATDPDTREDRVQFNLVESPRHGVLELGSSWGGYERTTRFTMADIYGNRLAYSHDGRDTDADDTFRFTVTDHAHSEFNVKTETGETRQSEPQVFSIRVTPVDDGTPILDVNLGLQYLDMVQGEAMNFITKDQLHASDVDTTPDLITYKVTQRPREGQLEKASRSGVAITSFTQAEVDNGEIKYVLTRNISATEDHFCFDLMDSRPNVVKGNTFHVLWSYVKFGEATVNVSETDGFVSVPVHRYGNLKQYSVVTCVTRAGTATARAGGSRPGRQDFSSQRAQVQFDEWQQLKFCTIVINDDSIFEGEEHFTVELTQPQYILISQPNRAVVSITDDEDQPLIQFQLAVQAVNESCGFVYAHVFRSGDSSVTASAVCATRSLTAQGSSASGLESGSDYQTRPANNDHRVVFAPGVTRATCNVRIIDDSLYETMEQFEMTLTQPSMLAKIGPIQTTLIIIEGPNDESVLRLSADVYQFDEDRGHVDIAVVRHGTDLSHTTLVWCATRMVEPPSAKPGQDYVAHSQKLTFAPGQRKAVCSVEILDDEFDPRLEGNETFIVFLSSPIGSLLVEPQSALVVINDTRLDVPVMQFAQDVYFVDEAEKMLSIPVLRAGDLSFTSSVVCYTRQASAAVGRDYEERVFTDASRLTMRPGEKSKNCSVVIVDDTQHEGDESFHLWLARPMGSERSGARVGARNGTTVTIRDPEDRARLQMELAAYSVSEPASPRQLGTLMVHVVRYGDPRGSVSVRCSTRDGSAVAGSDYRANSQLLTFSAGISRLEFVVQILHNEAAEWHESFFVALSLEGRGGAASSEGGCMLGTPAVATITILDCQVSSTLILPTPPMVVSLLEYDNIQDQEAPRTPSPGYPIVCVTPCDPRHPSFSVTGALCDRAGLRPSTVQFRWEVALPAAPSAPLSPPFEPLTGSTPFTSVTAAVLDSVHFGPRFRIRCSAQPLHRDGSLGVPLLSGAVSIAPADGPDALCRAPASGVGLHAQSFVASLRYVEPSSGGRHANTLHLRVRVPHHDGMLPLVSTLPIHNIRLLLAEVAYRQQHACSNFVAPEEQADDTRHSMLVTDDDAAPPSGPGFQLPYQLSEAVRGAPSVRLYRHLDLRSCTWQFDGWYAMARLVSVCGGSVVSDFEARDAARSYLTVRVPLYVSYVRARAPAGWTTAEQRTELQLSFYYSTMLWKTGLTAGGGAGGVNATAPAARLQLLRLGVGRRGNLQIDFKTRTNFRGQFVLSHHTLPGAMSKVIAPPDLPLTFDLSLVWSQQTFDAPSQIWRATSDFNLKDYSGEYTIELLPCTVYGTERYSEPLKCTAQSPQRFSVPITFQQTIRPVPLVYSLDTRFELTSSKDVFLAPPLPASELDEATVFTPDQTLYGRVLWDPAHDLEAAYKLQIEKLYICTGSDGHVPFYDPTGEVYNEGPQYGCLQPGGKVKYRFLVLDYGDRDAMDLQFNDLPFDAHFASDKPEYRDVQRMPGVDGFSFSVAPLFKASAGLQWYLQVIYAIGPADQVLERLGRSLSARRVRRSSLSALPDARRKNGTNMHVLALNVSGVAAVAQHTSSAAAVMLAVVLPSVVAAVAFLCCVACCCLCRRRRRRRHRDKTPSDTIYRDGGGATAQRRKVETVAYQGNRRVATTTVKSKVANRKVRHTPERPKSGTEV